MIRYALIVLMGSLVGGWATISVKDVPDYMVVGQPTQLSFRV